MVLEYVEKDAKRTSAELRGTYFWGLNGLYERSCLVRNYRRMF